MLYSFLPKRIDYIKKDDFLQKVKDIQIDKHFHITVSIGITFIKADNAFYKAKAKIIMIYKSRNKCSVYFYFYIIVVLSL